MIDKVSQSFMKDVRSYFKKEECGHILKAKYVDGNPVALGEPGQLAELGTYFEYIFTLAMTGTGSLPKNGIKPEPKYVAKKVAEKQKYIGGRELTADDMTEPYQTAHRNCDYLVKVFKSMGLVILRSGVKITNDGSEGTIDLVVQCTKTIKFENCSTWQKGTVIVIDMKYSALLDAGWYKGRHGWKWTPEQKEYHGTQAIQYSYLAKYPFYFLVIQSNNKFKDPMVKFFHVPVTEAMIADHLKEGQDLKSKFLATIDYGFVAYPSLEKCNQCPLSEACKDKQTFPQVETVDLLSV